MKQFISNDLQSKLRDAHKNSGFQKCKMLYLWCFFAGFVLLWIMGKDFWDNISLLSVNTLREIKDSTIDKSAFGQYVLWRRLFVLGTGACFWWWNLGKWYIYGVCGSCGISMGACMCTCLMRYRFKGIFLWFFLYFPYVIFYCGAVLLGLIMAGGSFKNRAEKIRFLWQKGVFVLAMAVLLFLGIYTESHTNVTMLQDFLQFF